MSPAVFFFLHATATTEIYTLSLHDALPISGETFFVPAGTPHSIGPGMVLCEIQEYSDLTYRVYDYGRVDAQGRPRDRKSTRLNSSHPSISYAVFCLKKKKKNH